MLRRISIFLLCLLLLGGSLWQMHYFRRLSRTLGEELSCLEQSAAQDPASMQTETQLSVLRRDWEENIPWLCMLLPHAQIDAIHLELLHLENLLPRGKASNWRPALPSFPISSRTSGGLTPSHLAMYSDMQKGIPVDAFF